MSLASSRKTLLFLDDVRLIPDKSNIGSVDSDKESSLSFLSEADIDWHFDPYMTSKNLDN